MTWHEPLVKCGFDINGTSFWALVVCGTVIMFGGVLQYLTVHTPTLACHFECQVHVNGPYHHHRCCLSHLTG